MIIINSKPKSIQAIDVQVPSGVQMTFDNGYTVSVQFGMGNYCENRGVSRSSSSNAEVAVFYPDGSFYPLSEFDDVKGYCGMDELADIIYMVKGL